MDIDGLVERLREALAVRDDAMKVCPYAKPHAPSSSENCKVCHADSSEPCRKRVIADAEFVDSARSALTGAG